MKEGRKAMALLPAVVTLGLLVPNVAVAQTDYVGTRPAEVAGVVISRNPAAANPGPEVAGVARGQAATTAGDSARVRSAVTEADGGSLPVTGGDIVGLLFLGMGAVGAGMVMVRRSRARSA